MATIIQLTGIKNGSDNPVFVNFDIVQYFKEIHEPRDGLETVIVFDQHQLISVKETPQQVAQKLESTKI